MLRRPPTPALHLVAPQQRAFWSQAVEILSRLKSAVTSITSAGADQDATKAAAREDPPRASKRTSAWRPHVTADAEFPDFLSTVSYGEVAAAKKAFNELTRVLERSRDSERLLRSWDVVRLCRPFVVEKQGVRLADDGNNAATGGSAKASHVLQMLPADVFAQRTAGTNHRTLFVGSLEGNVTAANEAVMVALLVQYLYALKDYRKTIEIFEGYSNDRRRWLKERAVGGTQADAASTVFTAGDGAFLASGDAEQQKEFLAFARATRLWRPARSAYVKSLVSRGRPYRRVVQFAREDRRNLETACESMDNMASLLIGCRKEKDSALARLAIETIAEKNPVFVLPLAFYELALKAAIQKKTRDDTDLDNALWVARAMRDDAGYVLHPDVWFALFNTSLHLKREDCAVEVFDMYSSNLTSPSQDHFRRAIRKACRLNHPDVALTIVRHWLAAVDGDASRVDAEAKTKVLDFVLSEMLASDHPVAAISEMLTIMESSRIETSGRELYRVVARVLDDDSERLSPHDAISKSLEFWRGHRAAVQNSVYLVYALLRHCLKRGWLDECELVVKEIVALRVSAVPCKSLVEVLDANETRGEFERNVRMCELLLKSLSRPAFGSLNQQFFESYLKALLCTGRFDKVCEQHARLKLGMRFAKSAPIAVALRGAQAQQA